MPRGMGHTLGRSRGTPGKKEHREAGMGHPKMLGDSRGWAVRHEWFWVISRVYVWEVLFIGSL